MMSTLPTIEIVLVCIAAALSALLLPSLALQRCRACSALSLRTLERQHRCPSRRHSTLCHAWVGFVLIWSGIAVVAAALD
jgi:hypothetical protein